MSTFRNISQYDRRISLNHQTMSVAVDETFTCDDSDDKAFFAVPSVWQEVATGPISYTPAAPDPEPDPEGEE